MDIMTTPQQSPTPLVLTNPTDSQLDAAFAERVAGWRRITEATNVAFEVPESGARGTPPPFSASADAILPWLEKAIWTATKHMPGFGYSVRIHRHDEPREWAGETSNEAHTFARAACIALLRAHGVEVVFTNPKSP